MMPRADSPYIEANFPEGHPAPERNLDCRRGKDRFLSRVRQQLFRLVRETARYGENALRQLERAFFAHVSFIAGHPDVPRRILSWSLHGGDGRLQRRVQKVITHYEFRVRRLIAQGQREGCIRADIEPHAASGLFVGMLQTLALRLPTERLEPEMVLQSATVMFSAYVGFLKPIGDTRGSAWTPRAHSSAV